jgi:catalase (peroxidase I)
MNTKMRANSAAGPWWGDPVEANCGGRAYGEPLQNIIMLTADLALLEDPEYLKFWTF